MLRTTLILGLLVGCDVGEVPLGGGVVDAGGGTDANSAAAASYQAMVAPLVAARGCTAVIPGAVGCHATGQAPNLANFSLLASKYMVKPGMTNLLVIKGEHQAQPFFDDAEKATVAAWIDSLP